MKRMSRIYVNFHSNLEANFRVERDSPKQLSSGFTVAMMAVLEFPPEWEEKAVAVSHMKLHVKNIYALPRESLSKNVSLESL
jgi:hypothetical protein